MSVFLDPTSLRSIVVNWDDAARAVITRIRRELLRRDPEPAAALSAFVRSFPGVAELWAEPDAGAPLPLLHEFHLRFGEAVVRLFVAVTTFASAGDRSLDEVRIESFFPADAESDQVMRAFVASLPPG